MVAADLAMSEIKLTDAGLDLDYALMARSVTPTLNACVLEVAPDTNAG